MAQLIPKDELSNLKPASEVKAVAKDAVELINLSSVAYLINTAANTGALYVLWQHNMTEGLKQKLEQEGYRVTPKQGTAQEDSQWIISFE